MLAKIIIPDGVTFADLTLSRSRGMGLEFNWSPLEAICAASGLDISLLRESHEDSVAGLIVAWYHEHRSRGGAPDPVADDLIAEVIAEDARGGGISYPPGQA